MAYGRGYETGDEGADIAFGMMRGVRAFGDIMQQGQRIEADRMALEDEKGINAAYEHIARKVGQTGDISVLDGDPLMNTRHGTMAAGKFLGQRAQNETSRLQMLKSMEAGDDHFYRNTFRPMAFAAQEAFQKGDIQRFGAIANELSARSPLPYRIEPTQDGNFRVRFRSSADGGWVDTGQAMTPQEVMEQIGGIIGGEQKILAGADMQTRIVNPRYLAAAARYRMGTIRSNADALADPKQWIPLTKGGHTIWAVPQNRHDDYSAAPAYRIVDEGGKMSGMVPNLDTLLQQGWGRGDVKAQLAGRQRVGQGKSGASAGGYKLTQGDVSMLTKYAAFENPETGEKSVDYGKVAFLQDFIQRTGRTTSAAIAAYDGNVKAAMAKGASREQAERAAMVAMAQMISGGQAKQTAHSAQGNPSGREADSPKSKVARAVTGILSDTPVVETQNADGGWGSQALANARAAHNADRMRNDEFNRAIEDAGYMRGIGDSWETAPGMPGDLRRDGWGADMERLRWKRQEDTRMQRRVQDAFGDMM